MDKNDDFVKRVVGLPGDTLEIKAGDVFINDKKLSEPYLAKDKSVDTMGPIRISEGEYFVMGDNRTVSLDSRRFGYIPKSGILGKVMLVWWPFSHVGIPD
jgi:signal peptidase I